MENRNWDTFSFVLMVTGIMLCFLGVILLRGKPASDGICLIMMVIGILLIAVSIKVRRWYHEDDNENLKPK